MIRYTKEYIQSLLDKYMDGTTTLEEEDILASYFRGNNIPQEWEDYRQLFEEIEAMKPQPKSDRRWIGWSIAAAAIVAGILYLALPHSQTEPAQPLVAQTDTTTTQPSEQLTPDTMPRHEEKAQPVQSKKRRLRKVNPTIHDYDKAYALTAQAEKEKREVEQQIKQCRQELIKAQMAAYGYVPVIQEDGTTIYMNEQTELIAYEE
jgi:hypothetical protein